MLVLSRQRDETIILGNDIEITVVDIRGDKVRLGVTAPKSISVHRKEVYDAILRNGPLADAIDPYLDITLRLARHVRNSDNQNPLSWGSVGMDLLAELQRLNPLAYDKFVK